MQQVVQPITVAVRSKALTIITGSNTGIEGSNPSQGMDVCCVRLFCVGRGPVQGILPTVYRIKKLKSGQGPTKGYRAIIIFEAASLSYTDLSRYGIVRKLPDSVFIIHHTENLCRNRASVSCLSTKMFRHTRTGIDLHVYRPVEERWHWCETPIWWT
jgi:hypothetical protein